MNVQYQYKTPGVYVQELDAFPPSIVGVETAVPVFIGYTQKADQNGRSLALQPVRIGSMVEYGAMFGGAYPHTFKLVELTDAKDKPNAEVKLGDKLYRLDLTKRWFLYNSLRLFYANGGSNCYVVSVGTCDPQTQVSKDALIAGLVAVKDIVGPTILVMPEAVLLEDNYGDVAQPMLNQCQSQGDRVALLDVWGAEKLAPNITTSALQPYLETFRAAVGKVHETLQYGAAYFPYLKTSIVDPTNPDEVNYTNFEPDSLTALKDGLKAEIKDPNSKLYTDYIDQMATLKPDDLAGRKKINQALTANLPAVVKNMYSVMAQKIGTLPPSAAMAGVYTANDTLRGVWNAPANVGLVSVVGPTVKISDDMQNGLNMPIDGLAINAIRDFVGRGTVVWGARTLDGNSNDWRYIQVRRALIYVEQSTKLALSRFVFEPNVAQTWVTVTSMISSFLRGMWAAGGLMGSTPQEAFTVQCGLGSTMTAQDILQGYMNVSITLQMVHPAEFIVLTFKQQMQGGGA